VEEEFLLSGSIQGTLLHWKNLLQNIYMVYMNFFSLEITFCSGTLSIQNLGILLVNIMIFKVLDPCLKY